MFTVVSVIVVLNLIWLLTLIVLVTTYSVMLDHKERSRRALSYFGHF